MPDQLRERALVNAYYIIKNYPLNASELAIAQFIEQQYGVSLKNACVELLLNLTLCKNNSGDLILLFKDPKYDQLARLITYGNGALPGSKILQHSLNSK